MNLHYQELEAFGRSLPLFIQWPLVILGIAVLYLAGSVIGASVGKALYFLTN